MSYITRAQLNEYPWAREIYILADIDGDGLEDDGVVNSCILWADNLINTKLSAVYTLPLLIYPQRLTDIAADIVRFRLYSNEPTEHVRMCYDDAIASLNAIRDGKESLQDVTDSSDEGEQAPNVIVAYQSDTAVFTTDVMDTIL